MTARSRIAWARAGVALVGTSLAAVLVSTALVGVGVPAVAVMPCAAAAALAGALAAARRLPEALDAGLRQHAALAVLWAVLAAGAVGVTARLATFMVDETRGERSVLPFDDFFVHHSCLSAHLQSARLQRDGVVNVYERTHFEGPSGEPKMVGSFVIDVFLYPPPFLLLSRAALALSENFAIWRPVWFALEGLIVLIALVAVARSLPEPTSHRALLLGALVWCSLPLLTTLQFGNFHLVAIAGALLAMLALQRGHHAAGGAVLAALAVGKVFPGILVLLLLLERRWRSLAWTAGFALGWVLLAWVVLGPLPFQAFFSYNLPRLSSGAALETLFVHPDTIAASHAIFGLVQKLELLGVPGTAPPAAAAVSWIYTGLLGLIAVGAARATAANPARRAVVWLALLQLASLRSPFTPDVYALVPILWILTLLLAEPGRPGWATAGLAALLVAANYIVPTAAIMPLPALLGLSVILQLVFLALCLGVFRPALAPSPVQSGGE